MEPIDESSMEAKLRRINHITRFSSQIRKKRLIRLTPEQYTNVILWCNDLSNASTVQDKFKSFYPGIQPPSEKRLSRICEHVQETGLLPPYLDLNSDGPIEQEVDYFNPKVPKTPIEIPLPMIDEDSSSFVTSKGLPSPFFNNSSNDSIQLLNSHSNNSTPLISPVTRNAPSSSNVTLVKQVIFKPKKVSYACSLNKKV